MAECSGAFVLVLHSHLPYVLGHDRLEEEWLFEAVVESYLPLLYALRRLSWQGISPKVTIGLTPVLLEQLAHPHFASQLLSYLEQKSDAARRDHRAFLSSNERYLARLARLWEDFYQRATVFFVSGLSSNIVQAFRRLQQAGQIEILTSAATHAYLPLLGFEQSVRAQVRIGAASYQQHFKARPQGFWLPECAYRPASYWTPPLPGIDGLVSEGRQAVDQILADIDIRYFIVDARQLTGSPPSYERHSPCRLHWVDGDSGPAAHPVAVFARDFETTARVWQHDAGYPGAPVYLEFHKKQGDGGLRYWRITDRRADLAHKQPYVPEWAVAQTATHAAHFVGVVRERLRRHRQLTGERGVVVAAFDTELFGHWWFEGPQWLYEVLRRFTTEGEVTPATCSEYFAQSPPQRTVRLKESSWGDGGDHRVWWQASTRGVWRNLYQAEAELRQLGAVLQGKKMDRSLLRLMRQCGRELLLLESSDWPFMIGTNNTPDHARQRAALHFAHFQRCRRMAERYAAGDALGDEEWALLQEIERQDALFPQLDPHLFWDDTPAAPELRPAASGDT
ncbi:MAG TPA: 1,4-alpha-glucan branching protein domain-containing protein [Methylomirabilota bacterium]|jgi:1,4-alpha-glucan branching enzyme|nr:1,4-alpha-glucan branching protein domain-containing protein [Methylomirabilota bacterium]